MLNYMKVLYYYAVIWVIPSMLTLIFIKITKWKHKTRNNPYGDLWIPEYLSG